MRRPKECSGMLEKWCVRAVKTFGTENLSSLVCNVSSNSFCGLWQMLATSASLLQLSCLNQTVMLFFSYAAIT